MEQVLMALAIEQRLTEVGERAKRDRFVVSLLTRARDGAPRSELAQLIKDATGAELVTDIDLDALGVDIDLIVAAEHQAAETAAQVEAGEAAMVDLLRGAPLDWAAQLAAARKGFAVGPKGRARDEVLAAIDRLAQRKGVTRG